MIMSNMNLLILRNISYLKLIPHTTLKYSESVKYLSTIHNKYFLSNFSNQNRVLRLRPLGVVTTFSNTNIQTRYESKGKNNKPVVDVDGNPIGDKIDPKTITKEEWAALLEPDAYFSTRESGTEAPFSGKYYSHKEGGIYKCVCCGIDLFSSKSKYDSGSGWPSFFSDKTSSTESNVYSRKDKSHGMIRTEILCKNCDAHLGHLFDDGPKPTGLRYCVNSASLKFTPKKIL